MIYFSEIPTGTALMGWMGCAAFLMVFLKQALWLRDRAVGASNGVSIDGQPLDVREVSDCVREKDCLSRNTLLQRQMDELKTERKADVRDLHEKVNGVAREVSEVKKAVEFLDQRVMQVDLKLDRMIEREK